MKRATLLFLGLMVLVGMTVGCEKKKFTYKRFTMIQNGMYKMEVEKILGEPEARWDDLWRFVDWDEHYSAAIKFDGGGQVIDKAWSDSVRQDPHPDSKWREGDWPESDEPGAAVPPPSDEPAPRREVIIEQDTVVVP
jgi:hypothetical protein